MIRSMIRSTINNEQWYKSMAAGNLITGDYELISTSLVANNSSSQVQFTNGGAWAPYLHLQLRITARQYWVSGSPDGTNLKVTLNNQGTTYRTHFMRGAGVSIA
jgi:hypothetical protein